MRAPTSSGMTSSRPMAAKWFWSISCPGTARPAWWRARAAAAARAPEREGMIPKSGYRFSERDHVQTQETRAGDGWRAGVRLSAIVITKDEAANIGDCLDSLAFCDERIVVDCGSSDGTLMIAKQKGARVGFHEWAGFGGQKNYALSLARGDGVLSLDADERVTPELQQAILAALDDSAVNGYEFPRRSSFCGRMMRHSGWFPDRVLRLFRRGKARFSA